MALTPGTRLGVYEVTAQIGEGGMGGVCKATDTNLRHAVTLHNPNRDLPVLRKYRSLLGGLVPRVYSLDTTGIARLFPNAIPLELGVI